MSECASVVCMGTDIHYKFSEVAFRDAKANLLRRERLDHVDRDKATGAVVPLASGLGGGSGGVFWLGVALGPDGGGWVS